MKVKTNVKAGATFTFSGANAGATISGTGNVGGTVNVGNTGIAQLRMGFDHGVGHPLLLLYDAKAPSSRKNKAFKGLGHYAQQPKVADAVIKACEDERRIYPKCNGLQWKWLRTAINDNLGPDYLHLSIPSGRDSVPLRLQLSSWDCNQRRWDHIKCDSPNHRLRPVFMRGEAYASLENALEVLLSRTSLDLGPSVSHYTSKHPIETPQRSLPPCSMRVDLKKTGEREGQARLVCWVVLFRCR